MAVIRRTGQVLNQPIGVKTNFDTGAAEIGRALERTGNIVREEAFRVASDKAQKAGEESALSVAVSEFKSIDPVTGEPAALKSPEGFGSIARQSYEKIANQRFANIIEQDVKAKAKELAIKYDLNPVAYRKNFDNYVTELAKNSEGRYRQFIVETGGVYGELTELNLKDAQRTRARQNTYELILRDTQRYLNDAANVASYNMKGAIALRDAALENLDDGRVAELPIGVNDVFEARENFNGAIASAYLIPKMKDLTPIQRTELIQAIRTQRNDLTTDETVRNLAFDVLSRMDNDNGEIISGVLISASNKTSVIAQLNGAASDYDQVLRLQQAAAKARASSYAENFEATFFDSLDAQDAGLLKGAYDSFFSDEMIAAPNAMSAPQAVLSNVNASIEFYNDTKRSIEASGMSAPKMEAAKRELRETLVRPLIEVATLDGNHVELRNALANGNKTGLTSKQIAIVDGLYSSVGDMFDKNNMGFANTIITNAQNKPAETRRKVEAKVNFDNAVAQASREIQSGATDQDQLDLLISEINANTDLGIDDKAKYQTALQLSVAKGVSNGIIDSMTPDQITQFSNYITRSGAGPTNLLTPQMVTAADIINNNVTDDTLGKVEAHIREIRKPIDNNYTQQQKDISKTRSVLNGTSGNTKDSGTHADKMISSLLDPSSTDPTATVMSFVTNGGAAAAVQTPVGVGLNSIIANGTMPRGINLAISKMFNGSLNDQEVVNTITYLTSLTSNIGEDGFQRNILHGLVDDKTLAQISGIVALAQVTGTESIPNFLRTMTQRTAVDIELSNKDLGGSGVKFILNSEHDDLKEIKENAKAVNMLAPLAEFLAASKMVTIDNIPEMLNNHYERIFQDTEGYVVDPKSPNVMRSTASLRKHFPEEKVMSAFLMHVETTLASVGDFRLIKSTASPSDQSKETNVSPFFQGMITQLGRLENETVDLKDRAFLIPMQEGTPMGTIWMAMSYDPVTGFNPIRVQPEGEEGSEVFNLVPAAFASNEQYILDAREKVAQERISASQPSPEEIRESEQLRQSGASGALQIEINKAEKKVGLR